MSNGTWLNTANNIQFLISWIRSKNIPTPDNKSGFWDTTKYGKRRNKIWNGIKVKPPRTKKTFFNGLVDLLNIERKSSSMIKNIPTEKVSSK